MSQDAADASDTPRRFIYNDSDMKEFLESPAKAELLKLTTAMGRSCASPSCSTFEYDPANPLLGLTPAMAVLHGSLSEMETWIEDIPPSTDIPVRFGNPAFRDWHARLVKRSPSILAAVLKTYHQYPDQENNAPQNLEEFSSNGKKAARVELSVQDASSEEIESHILSELCAYLHASFGHQVRLDYGTGHECSFQVLLLSLCKIGCFGSTATQPPTALRLKAVTLSIWSAYLRVTRTLQKEYMLEPAGSHGVWGLDDYHCLPFFFGASQLEGEDTTTPDCIHDRDTLEQGKEKYLYFGCISYIKTLKKGVPFFECSPMLNDISNLGSWKKVSAGLLKLFEGEVLKKRQVVQHFVFGALFAANWTPSQKEPPSAPTESFRVPEGPAPGNSGAVMPLTRAPWAK